MLCASYVSYCIFTVIVFKKQIKNTFYNKLNIPAVNFESAVCVDIPVIIVFNFDKQLGNFFRGAYSAFGGAGLADIGNQVVNSRPTYAILSESLTTHTSQVKGRVTSLWKFLKSIASSLGKSMVSLTSPQWEIIPSLTA